MDGGTSDTIVSRLVLGAVLVVAVILAAPSTVVACSGTALAGQDTTDPNAAVIFSGTAVRREDVGFLRFGGNLFDPVRWTFVVDGVDKGVADRRMTVESERADASCGVVFRLGHRYRVVVSDLGHGPQVWSNSGTRELEAAAIPPPIEGGGVSIEPWWIVVLGLATLLSVVAFTRRGKAVAAS